MTIKRRLIAHLRKLVKRADNPAENHPNLLSHPHGHRTDQPESPGLNPGLIEIATDLICISSSNEDGPILDAIANKDEDRFLTLCRAASGSDAPKTQEAVRAKQAGLDKLWNAAKNTIPQVWDIISNTLNHSEAPLLLFKAIQCGTKPELEKKLEGLPTGIAHTTRWTTKLEHAIRDATPNLGKKGRLNFVQRRLLRNGYAEAATTYFGTVVALRTKAVNIGHLIPGDTYQNYLLPETRPTQRWRVNWTHERNHKIEIMRKLLPPLPFPHLANLVDSELCVAVITRNTDESHSKREPERATVREIASIRTTPPTSITWADDQGRGAGMRIDNEEFKSQPFPLPPLTQHPPAPSNPTAPKTAWCEEKKKKVDMNPTRIVMEGHSFWRKKKNGKKVQDWVLQKADARKHKACVVLEHNTGRLYTSFPNAHAFWEYYSRYKGRRCFYWINRSHGQAEEISLLHFDIEWFSATTEDDPTTEERLQILRAAINNSLPKPCEFTLERLSRPSPKGNHEWKNSWHLYAKNTTFENNAQGCMRDFVRDKVWERIKAHPLMRCPVKGKPILDLGVYTKNRCWRVPGSTKGAEWPGENEPLPEMALFMQTRMSDRQGSPTFSTSELGITEERHRKRKLNPNPCPRPHTGKKNVGVNG